ncbi:HNH endonuclease [Saccharopolyspora sp. 5N708]|uniref:HNH endonuclease n=1 Tax=Saccharopolyspora sp. 5N708 TaxID=3457424 RepID=UPI003FD52946
MAGFVNSVLNLLQFAILVLIAVAGISVWQRRWPPTPPFARPRGTSSAQLRSDQNAKFFYDRGFLFLRRWFFVGTGCPPARINRQRLGEMRTEQADQPVRVASTAGRTWWWFENNFYWESGGYSASDVIALVRDRQRKDKAKLDRAHAQLDGDRRSPARRPTISREVKMRVFQRDGGRCVQCGTDFEIQYDHVIPVALGGSSTEQNLQLLCARCNQSKGANL